MSSEKDLKRMNPADAPDSAPSGGDELCAPPVAGGESETGLGGIVVSGKTYKIIITIIVLAVAFITFWFMMELVILTFILTFVFYHFQKLVERGWTGLGTSKLARSGRVRITPLPHWASLIIVYVVGLTAVVLFIWGFTTVIVDQAQEIGQTMKGFDINNVKDSLDPQFAALLNSLDIGQYINKLVEDIGTSLLDFIKSAGNMMLHFGMALVISFLFLIERDNIGRFGAKVSESRIGFIYDYFIEFGSNFCRTFGKVMKVQVTIALVNSLLSTLLLHLFGMPNVLGLGLMVFALGLIPVAGVIISIIPLAIIAFNTGGLFKVLEILIMVAVLHAVEAYVLNPKLMAHRTALPVSFVFVILIVAEKYLHIWGLLIGVPLFIFIASIFRVDYEEVCKQPPSKIAQKIRELRKGKTGKKAAAGPDRKAAGKTGSAS